MENNILKERNGMLAPGLIIAAVIIIIGLSPRFRTGDGKSSVKVAEPVEYVYVPHTYAANVNSPTFLDDDVGDIAIGETQEDGYRPILVSINGNEPIQIIPRYEASYGRPVIRQPTTAWHGTVSYVCPGKSLRIFVREQKKPKGS